MFLPSSNRLLVILLESLELDQQLGHSRDALDFVLAISDGNGVGLSLALAHDEDEVVLCELRLSYLFVINPIYIFFRGKLKGYENVVTKSLTLNNFAGKLSKNNSSEIVITISRHVTNLFVQSAVRFVHVHIVACLMDLILHLGCVIVVLGVHGHDTRLPR